MSSPNSFDLFPALPAELRLKIYSYALPHRILQMGYDFPFPFLESPSDPTVALPSSQRGQCLQPVHASLPALFHVCHESRQLCLSTYVPFAYTYAHPHNDTLYVSSKAASLLHQNLNWYYKCARPALYPLAVLDRIAVEFDWLDLPPQARANSGWLVVDNRKYLFSSPLLESYLAAFAEFGAPKELLVIEGTVKDWPGASASMRGWEFIKFVGNTDLYGEGKSEVVLQYIHDNWCYKRDDHPWFRERLPEVKIMGVRKEGDAMRDAGASSKLLILSNEVAREWQEKEEKLHERPWDFSTNGSPYEIVNMGRALARAKMASTFESAG